MKQTYWTVLIGTVLVAAIFGLIRTSPHDKPKPSIAAPTTDGTFRGEATGRIAFLSKNGVPTILREKGAPVTHMIVSRDKKWLLTADADGYLESWDAKKKTHIETIWSPPPSGPYQIQAVAFTGDNTWAIVTAESGLGLICRAVDILHGIDVELTSMPFGEAGDYVGAIEWRQQRKTPLAPSADLRIAYHEARIKSLKETGN